MITSLIFFVGVGSSEIAKELPAPNRIIILHKPIVSTLKPPRIVFKRKSNTKTSRGRFDLNLEGFRVVKKISNVKLTFYDLCFKCVGKSRGYGASGRKVVAFKSIAVDTSLIPLDTYVYIEGYGVMRADDTGGAIRGKKIDIFTDLPHKENLRLGKIYRTVYVLEKE